MFFLGVACEHGGKVISFNDLVCFRPAVTKRIGDKVSFLIAACCRLFNC